MFRASLPSIIVNHNACHAIYHHLTQPWQCDSQKTHNTIRLKWCTRHANRRLRSPNLCACQETWNSSSENLAKASRLSEKRLGKDTWECHKVPCLPHETMLRDVSNLQKWPLPVGTAIESPHSRASDGCWRLRAQKQRRANTGLLPDPKVKREPFAHSGSFGKNTSS